MDQMGQGHRGGSASPPIDPSCGWESHMAKLGMGTKEDKKATGPKEGLASSGLESF